MSHQEKQEIFDQYAKKQGYQKWEDLVMFSGFTFSARLALITHMYNACDLVQEEQQKRIAASLKNVEVAESTMREYADEIGMMDEEEYMEVRKKIIKKKQRVYKVR